MLLFPNENRKMIHVHNDNGEEEHNNENSNRYCFIPLIADSAIDLEQVFNAKVSYGNEDDMESDNDQSADSRDIFSEIQKELIIKTPQRY